MNKKKLTIIVCSVLAVLVVGLLVNHFFNWPINTNDASGDISKASRFSREMESEKLTNMEELLKNDTTFKEGIVLAQVVMQTRAAQFGTLVDMSNEVAGNIPDFAEVLKEMNATLEMVNNVVNSLIKSGQNLDNALSGKECANLEQTTINASLAYTTLQKQNKLANKFIETTDKYLKTAEGSDVLKFVRDQWVDYQKMTAALEGDKDAAEAMAKKGNLLNAERTLAAVISFNPGSVAHLMNGADIQNEMGIENSLHSAISAETMHNVVTTIRNAAAEYCQNTAAETMNNSQASAKFNQTVSEVMYNTAAVVSNTGRATMQNTGRATMQNTGRATMQNTGRATMQNTGRATLQNTSIQMMNNIHVNQVSDKLLGYGGGAGKVRPGIGSITSSENLSSTTTHEKLGSNTAMGKLNSQLVDEVIRATAAGNMVSNRIINR